MSLSLTNTRGLRLTFVLVHDIFCVHGRRCACVAAIRPRRGRRPSSLSIEPGETARDLSPAILALPDVERAVRQGRLRLTRVA